MCRWCHEPCGDREFCSADCYEQLVEAEAEVGWEDGCEAAWQEGPAVERGAARRIGA